MTRETPDPSATGAKVATSRADTDVSSAAHEAAKAAARATPRGEKPLERTIVWTVEFLKRSPLSTAAPKEAARQPMPRPMAAVAASLKRVWGLIPKNGFPRSLSSALVSPPVPTTSATGEPSPGRTTASVSLAAAETAETAAAETPSAPQSRLSAAGSKNAARLPGSSDDLRSSKATL